MSEYEKLPSLFNPELLKSVSSTPVSQIRDAAEIKIEVRHTDKGICVAVNAPDERIAEEIIKKIFGDSASMITVMCG